MRCVPVPSFAARNASAAQPTSSSVPPGRRRSSTLRQTFNPTRRIAVTLGMEHGPDDQGIHPPEHASPGERNDVIADEESSRSVIVPSDDPTAMLNDGRSE